MSLRSHLLAALRDRLGAEGVPLRIVFWDGESFDLTPDPTVTITLHSPHLLRLFLTGGMGRLAQAYVAGELTADGRIEDVLRVGLALAERLGKVPLLRRLAPLAGPRWGAATAGRATPRRCATTTTSRTNSTACGSTATWSIPVPIS
jgi:cyclopropane-fatty-acyl-phospholipid synthase